jgi:hypothetical protein
MKAYLSFYIIKNIYKAGYRWFTPIIVVTQEAEIRRISVQSQPGQIVPGDPILKKPFTKKGWWSGSRCRP